MRGAISLVLLLLACCAPLAAQASGAILMHSLDGGRTFVKAGSLELSENVRGAPHLS